MLVSMSDKELKRSSVLQEICDQLLGDKLMARSFPSQVNEIHARVAVLNRFTELGRHLPKLRLKFGSIRGALHFKSLCNKAE